MARNVGRREVVLRMGYRATGARSVRWSSRSRSRRPRRCGLSDRSHDGKKEARKTRGLARWPWRGEWRNALCMGQQANLTSLTGAKVAFCRCNTLCSRPNAVRVYSSPHRKIRNGCPAWLSVTSRKEERSPHPSPHAAPHTCFVPAVREHVPWARSI